MSDEPEVDQQFLDMFRRADEATARAQEIYDALKATKSVSKHRLIVYRCQARHCLLLEVIETPAGLIVHKPRYKLSPTENERRSNASGRRANTEDGNNRWKRNVFPIEAAINSTLTCDHVLEHVVDFAEVEDAIANGRREVLVGP